MSPNGNSDSQDDTFNPSYSHSHSHHSAHERKRRVGKACDSCRIKKTKCDGRKPCSKCVADNKICVFSERKRQKDKNHAPGYVELLETRVDLLKRSLEKMWCMLKENRDLTFLVKDTELEDFSVNKIITMLINQEGLLDSQPIEWDDGTRIAAAMPDDDEGISKASGEFAKHAKGLVEKPNMERTQSEDLSYGRYPIDGFMGKLDLGSMDAFKPDLQDLSLDPTSGTHQYDMPDLTLGPYSSAASLAAAAASGGLCMSDFESNGSFDYSPESYGSPSREQVSGLPNTWQDEPPLPVDPPTSQLISPVTSPRPSFSKNASSQKPRRSHSGPRPYSPSMNGQKKVINDHSGHISKPHHHNLHHAYSLTDFQAMPSSSLGNHISSSSTDTLVRRDTPKREPDEWGPTDVMTPLDTLNSNMNGLWINTGEGSEYRVSLLG